MTLRYWNRWTVVACGLAVVALVATPSLLAAPPSNSEKPSAAAKPAAAQKVTAKKPVAPDAKNPRMPDHFNKVVNGEQRDKVVEILKQYQGQIEQKRAELKALTDERDTAVMKVLSPAQRSQVEELRAATEAKRKAALAASRAEDGAAAISKDAKP